jgi:hypothetical protein
LETWNRRISSLPDIFAGVPHHQNVSSLTHCGGKQVVMLTQFAADAINRAAILHSRRA